MGVGVGAGDPGVDVWLGVAEVEVFVAMGGFGLLTGSNASNNGSIIVTLKPWAERQSASTSLGAVMARVRVVML